MIITVFGASGKVGRLVTKKLLDDKHTVVVFVHRSSPFKETNHLVVIRGDIHNVDDVHKAIKGSDAVISTLGSWGTKPKDIVSSGIANILKSASENKIKRIVSLTGSDAIASGDRSSLFGNLLHFFIKISPARKILADGEKHIKLLEESELDWTVLRSPVMNNKGNPNDFILSEVKPKFWQTINRQAVANAIVGLVENEGYHHQAPYIKRGKA